MSTLSSFKKTSNTIQFKISNKKNIYDVAIVNALRRSILMNLETYCISRDAIYFQKNTSIYSEDFLTQRFSLLPLNSKVLSKYDISKIEGYFQATNTNVVDPISFYAKDIKFYYGDDDEPIENRKLINNVITIPDILLVKIKPDQELYCTIKLKKGTHKEDGAMFCPVSKCVYFFETDTKSFSSEISKLPVEKQRELAPILREQLYLKNAEGIPTIYNFMIECDDILPIQDIFTMGCDYLINFCKSWQEEIKNINISTRMRIETSPTNMKAYDFIFEKSDDTLGNIIQTYGMKDKEIKYIGYHIPHPLDRILYVRVSLVNEKAGINLYEKKMNSLLALLIKIIEKLRKDYLNSL